MEGRMKITRVLGRIALCAVGAAFLGAPTNARADLVLLGGTVASSFTDLTAQGFGNAPRLITLQTSGSETGGVSGTGTLSGDAVSGANKSGFTTLSTVGWADASQ